MYQNDYIIAFDENGKPYIAHSAVGDAVNRVASAVKNARGDRQNHKYILKIDENGRKRYFYTQDEVKAYYEEKRKQAAGAVDKAKEGVKNALSNAKNVVREATGQAARDRMDAAAAKYPELLKNRQQKDEEYETASRRVKNLNGTLADAYADARVAEDRANRSNIFNRSKRNAEAEEAREKEKQVRANWDAALDKEIKAMNESINANQKYGQSYEDYFNNKAAYDKSLAGAVDRTAARARDIASDANDTASAAYNKAKDSANNTVTNAKNRFERMKSEFRDKAEQTGNAAKSAASKVADKAEDLSAKATSTTQAAKESAQNMIDKARTVVKDKAEDLSAKATSTTQAAKSSAQDMIDKARTAIKDKAEDLSAKAKSTAQAAKESAQGMIENARSSTAKAVNEAWDKIPKNADGTVNPFDSNFQSAYNDWKSKKEKYDGSLTGQAKAVAEKATDSVKDMIDQAKKTVKDASQQISDNLDVKQLQKNLERDMKNHGYSLEDAYNQHKEWLKNMQSGQLPEDHKEYYKKASELEDQAYKELKDKRSAKKYFNEYSDNDSDFDDKNYSKENHVEDTDFYSFKRKDGKSVILEEDMKWVLPRGVDASNPAIKSALKKIANSGNFKSYDDWLENANDILGDAIEKVRDKEK